MNTAWLDKDTELNRALDAVHKAGIGLISMKQIAGPKPEEFLAQVPQKAPDLIAKGLSPFGALLHAIWSDERFSTCCVSMRNTDQLRDNIESRAEVQGAAEDGRDRVAPPGVPRLEARPSAPTATAAARSPRAPRRRSATSPAI